MLVLALILLPMQILKIETHWHFY